MKMKKIFTLFLLMLTICTTAQAAGGSTFYYKFVVQPNETGAGKVYASNKELDPETVSYKDYYGTSVFSEGSLPNVKTVTVTAYLYAQPEDGYMFTHWARVENNKETIFSNARHTSDLVTSTHTDKTDPQVTRYKAYFAKYGVAYPVSSDETLGTVSIDIPTNQIGDDITMTATPTLLVAVSRDGGATTRLPSSPTTPSPLRCPMPTKGCTPPSLSQVVWMTRVFSSLCRMLAPSDSSESAAIQREPSMKTSAISSTP